MQLKYVCARCGVKVGYWFYGWKHQNGGLKARKSCGQKPMPVPYERSSSAGSVRRA